MSSVDESITEINHANIYQFGKDDVVNRTSWPSVWFSKIKQKFFKELEENHADISLKLALCNFLNEIDEVNIITTKNKVINL